MNSFEPCGAYGATCRASGMHHRGSNSRLAASPSADRVVAPRVERTLFEAWLSGRRGPTKDGGLKVSPPDGAKGGKTRLSGQDQGVEDQHQN